MRAPTHGAALILAGLTLWTTALAGGCIVMQEGDDGDSSPDGPTVVGGNPDTAGFYTFVVKVNGVCSGAVITSRHILTAAHCLCEPDSYTDPDNDQVNERESPGAKCVSAAEVNVVDAQNVEQASITSSAVTIHPEYFMNLHTVRDADGRVTEQSIISQRADIAVIELPTAVDARFGLVPYSSTEPAEGAAVTLVGFGATDCDSQSLGPRHVGNNEISGTSDNRDLLFINSASSGSLNWKGDSGGPLLTTMDGALKVVGVTSRGDCMHSGGFTNVAKYAGWLSSVISSTAGSVCGNFNCQAGEEAATCCTDCGCPLPQVCSNNVCQSGTDACAEVADGLYCGSALAGFQGNADDLVSCMGNHIAWVSTCGEGCQVQQGDDTCGGGCTDSCGPPGTPRCASAGVRETCGNFDADSCNEWGNQELCSCQNGQCQAQCVDTYQIAAYQCETYTTASSSGPGGGEIFKICGDVDPATGFMQIKATKANATTFGSRPYHVRVSAAGDPACGPGANYFIAASNPSGIGTGTLTFNFQSSWAAGQVDKYYCVTAQTQQGDPGYNANDPLQESWWYSKKIGLLKSCQ